MLSLMTKDQNDDQRVVTTTVARLKAFEAAVRARQDARCRADRAYDAFEKAKEHLERARKEESNAQDAETNAAAALYDGAM